MGSTHTECEWCAGAMIYLDEADLSDAVLLDAALRGTDLPRAVLLGANLSGADLTGALLSEAIFTDGRTCAPGSLTTCS
jgi:uncharacterized protein YjbI with pentapeptide repeats